MGSTTAATAAPIRLAILDCDKLLPALCEKYNSDGYTAVFRALFASAAAPATLDSVLTITGHDVVLGDPHTVYPSLDEVDALLLTGSKHNAFADDEWIVRLVEYTRKALASDKVRVIGICFGHQIIGRALGVPVERNPKGWEVGVTKLTLTPKGKVVFGQDALSIHQMHQDVVFSVPAGAESLAETDICPVQGFLLPGRAITLQGHPEFSEYITREILKVREDLLPDELWQSGMDHVADHHDGVAMARAFVRFMQEGR